MVIVNGVKPKFCGSCKYVKYYSNPLQLVRCELNGMDVARDWSCESYISRVDYVIAQISDVIISERSMTRTIMGIADVLWGAHNSFFISDFNRINDYLEEIITMTNHKPFDQAQPWTKKPMLVSQDEKTNNKTED